MVITVKRIWFTDLSTIGEMNFDDLKFFTLEDTVRKIKIIKKTAIPAGRYEVIIDNSVRFGRPMPLLLNVPNFEGVRIHRGNYPGDTEGCLLIGKFYDPKIQDVITGSKIAFDEFFLKLEEILKNEKVFLAIS